MGWAWVARDGREQCRRVGWDLARGSGRMCRFVSVGLLCLCARDGVIERLCEDEFLTNDGEMDGCGSVISRLSRLMSHRRIFDRLWRMCWRLMCGVGCWTRSLSLVAAFLPWVVDVPSPNLYWGAVDVEGHVEVVEGWVWCMLQVGEVVKLARITPCRSCGMSFLTLSTRTSHPS